MCLNILADIRSSQGETGAQCIGNRAYADLHTQDITFDVGPKSGAVQISATEWIDKEDMRRISDNQFRGRQKCKKSNRLCESFGIEIEMLMWLESRAQSRINSSVP